MGVVLEEEADGVGFLAGFDLVALVHVEQVEGTQQFLFGLEGQGFQLGVTDRAVQHHGQVTPHGRELGELGALHRLLLRSLQQEVPVDIGIRHLGLDVELLRHAALHHAETHEGLLPRRPRQSLRQLGMVRRLLLPLGLVDAAALQQLLHHGLEVKEARRRFRRVPGRLVLAAAEVQRQVPALGVLAFQFVIRLPELVEAYVRLLAVAVPGDGFEAGRQHVEAQHTQVAAQRVEQAHSLLRLHRRTFGILFFRE